MDEKKVMQGLRSEPGLEAFLAIFKKEYPLIELRADIRSWLQNPGRKFSDITPENVITPAKVGQ